MKAVLSQSCLPFFSERMKHVLLGFLLVPDSRAIVASSHYTACPTFLGHALLVKLAILSADKPVA